MRFNRSQALSLAGTSVPTFDARKRRGGYRFLDSGVYEDDADARGHSRYSMTDVLFMAIYEQVLSENLMTWEDAEYIIGNQWPVIAQAQIAGAFDNETASKYSEKSSLFLGLVQFSDGQQHFFSDMSGLSALYTSLKARDCTPRTVAMIDVSAIYQRMADRLLRGLAA